MNSSIKYLITLFALMIIVACGNQKSSQEDSSAQKEAPKIDYYNDAYLVEATDVKQMIENSATFTLIEVSKLEDYESSHVPGALNIWRSEYENREDYDYGGMIATKEKMETLLTRLGASSDHEIIIYDTKGNVDALRFVFILRRYGHDKVRIINGGKNGWTDAGFSLDTTPVQLVSITTPFVFDSTKESIAHYASKEEVIAALDDPNVILLDVRTLDEYTGKMLKNGAAKAGRLPKSIHIDWANTIDYDESFRFKEAADLMYLYESKGVTKDKKIIAYCHTGVRSAHTQFVLSELLGYKNVKNYDGSWTEWSHDDNLPFEIDPKEELVGTPTID
ncbi:sulfurtransferase [Marivirga harenae]|uniref:sulfurtransferase n=1 Tax=Marivirga harenae TaxID=2010992 RepID=UPI0026DEF28F|nr:sulfurtransferase [Marivirga harenae]WKV12433.1 sulfurtransferase [Marivirga harenae]|tara:strand:+ start:99361 stop:100362 length:1002 start_codon:yes stop_codon:yes gene_type:complete